MNLLLEGGKISEQRVNENFSYTLEKDCSLNQMEYKVMQSQNGTEFVNCMSVLFNGKNQLLYMPGELKTLLSMSRGIDEEDFITIIASLLGCVADIKKNGFLSCQNIEIASDKIYVDPVTYNIRLIYVPIQPKIYEDYTSFEDDLRMGVTRIINSEFNMHGKKIQQLYYDLYDKAVKLEDLYEKIRKKNTDNDQATKKESEKTSRVKRMCLTALDAPIHTVIEVNQDALSIGRNASMSDVAINFNSAIGRKHCTILRNASFFMIKDENSVNGTFVNNVKVVPGQIRRLDDGDVISLANTKFKVKIYE
ncbi:MAG: FHA domain-containing protein [Lachnospiraceae bacterium]|nr:FHA domain-containing protein [Lachnospiraceae bacterium]